MTEPTPEVSAGSEADSGIQKQIGPLKLWQWAAVLLGAFLVYRVIRGGSSSSGGSVSGPVTTGNDSSSAVGMPTAADFTNLADAIKNFDPTSGVPTPIGGGGGCGPMPLSPQKTGTSRVCIPGVGWKDIPTSQVKPDQIVGSIVGSGTSGSGSGSGSSGSGSGAAAAVAPVTAPLGTSAPTIVSATEAVVGAATSIAPPTVGSPFDRATATTSATILQQGGGGKSTITVQAGPKGVTGGKPIPKTKPTTAPVAGPKGVTGGKPIPKPKPVATSDSGGSRNKVL